MREILFRAKRKDLGKCEWVYGTGIVPVKHNTYDTNEYEMIQEVNYDELDYCFPSYDSETINTKTLGQYTGLKDKNGKEIYEGDIVEVSEEGRMLFGSRKHLTRKYSLIGFHDGAFMLGRNEIDFSRMDTYLYGMKDYISVVGNIYENKNLLEEENK